MEGKVSAGVIEVVVAVLLDGEGRVLLAQRPSGKVYAGYWEFPGGKVEADEPLARALRRELAEELGITVRTGFPWVTRSYSYPHASVRLHFFRVTDWVGELHPHEGQALSWQNVGEVGVAPILPANGPILHALALPTVYGITHATELGLATFLDLLDQALASGLRLIQLREKGLDASALDALGGDVVRRCHAAGAKVVVNGDVDVAHRIGADGVHLTAARLMAAPWRPAIALCGASCHDRAELDRAAALGVDFVVLGPVHPTPSHAGAPPLGWERFARLIEGYPLPVFALGGICRDDAILAMSHGAHGIAMKRGAWRRD